jgi:homoserine O-acetyltransferase
MSHYDTDVYAWSERQGALPRRLAAGDCVTDAELDWPNIAEEIETVGRSERSALTGHISNVIEHLIKLEISSATDPRAGWKETILRGRSEAEELLRDGPSLRTSVGDLIARRLPAARRLAVAALLRMLTIAALFLLAPSVRAADYPVPQQADWVAQDFRFHTGEVMRDLRLHYTTVGASSGEPVLMIHGTAGSGSSMLTAAFAGELFGPGQPLDARKYFIILPDTLGAGKSAKPSDGLRGKFPRYDYDDMVLAEYRLVTEGLGIHHLRLVLGNSMGGMHVWLWGVTYPGFSDALVPMASQPTAMAARNWMLRRLMIETIRQDPAYDNGNYTQQPRSLRYAAVFLGTATSGGTLAYQSLAPTTAQADALVDARLAEPFTADANDWVYQWDASRDYDPAAKLDRIDAAVLAINSADDERNPAETGVMQRVKNGRIYLIPASAETRGHGTTSMARFWQHQLAAFLQGVPGRGK